MQKPLAVHILRCFALLSALVSAIAEKPVVSFRPFAPFAAVTEFFAAKRAVHCELRFEFGNTLLRLC